MNPDYVAAAPLASDTRFELLRGRRAGSGTPVLLKRARRDPTGPAELAALQRECALAAGLATALQPRLLEAPPPALLVMDDPGGELLASLLARGRLPVDVALAFGAQLASTLAELHGRGLVHRGLRPEAVLCRLADRRAWLVDFGDAAAGGLPGDASAAALSRLVYMAPEQSGRIDGAVDARSDLYALGVLLYEMLTGAPPFRSDDRLEQIHWHLAGVPSEPARLVAGVPPMVSALVLKLLAKSPDERYQSAAGLAEDLAHCMREWSREGRVAPFVLGRHDLGTRLVVPSRLIGRERELHLLLEAFERSCEGRGGMLLLVEGYAGVGKTALIRQMVPAIAGRHGHFISGKFDLVARGTPFGALIQAFRALVRQLLTQDEPRLHRWRRVISSALGANAGVLAEVMPEITHIVGPQPAPTSLGAAEAQNRFQRVLQNFVAALAQPEHPLVLFLDDLQWADAATLGLLEPLLASTDIRSLLLIGAYRDNEVDASPRLVPTLAALAAADVALQRVVLAPLARPELAQLVADMLRGSAADAEPLARLVHAKTGGNPLFVIQFLKQLEREGHLRFDEQRARWVYRIEQIADAPLADSVVELMTRSILRLPAKAQRTLTLAACIGNRFDRETLALVGEQSPGATAEDLAHALAEGLVVAASPTHEGAGQDGGAPAYAFLHDRVQQAAYALVPEALRPRLHLAIGRLLRARGDEGGFDVVQHLNRGRALIDDPAERQAVASLNLAAGRRAKASTAFDSALELFEAGIGLLGEPGWSIDPTLCFELHLEAAEGLYLCGRFDEALDALARLDRRARTPIERARTMRLRSLQYENMARYAEAVASTREALALFDVRLPDTEAAQAAALEREIEAIASRRGGREIASLVDLPTMRDPPMRIVMAMLTDIWSSAYLVGAATLARLVSATMVRLSLQHGNVEESAYGYVTHAITVGPVRGDYREAYAYGRLALAVNERFDDTRRRAKIYQQFQAHVNLWCAPLASCVPYAREACRSGLDNGDFLYAAYGAATEAWAALASTADLAAFVRATAPSVGLVEGLKNRGFADSLRLLLGFAAALQGRGAAPLSMSSASFDEAAWLQSYRGHPFFASIHAVLRLQLCVLLGTPAEALQAAQHADALVHNVPGTVWPVIAEFWHALALAGLAAEQPEPRRTAAMARIDAARLAFEARAVHCAENFRSQALLLGAVSARLQGRWRDAVEACEQALEFACAPASLLPYRALAHEMLAQLHAQRAQAHLAGMHLDAAADDWARWGAAAKVEALRRAHPGPDGPRGAGTSAPASLPGAAPEARDGDRTEGAGGLDLHSVLKATQAISGELERPDLLARLLHIAIENAGAERGALVLDGDGAAEALVYSGDASAVVPLDSADHLPVGVVHYVRRTGETVSLANAEADEVHGRDPYIARQRPRSLACVPIRHQGRTIGALYLEHCQAAAVFTPQRLLTLASLATQAAIALDNARLVAGLKREIAEREQAQHRLGEALAELQRLKDELEAENVYLRRDLIANVSHDLRTPLVSMRGYLEMLATKGDSLAAGQQQQYLDIAVRQSERLATLVDELFELAKLDFKGAVIRREPVALAELAVDVVQKFQLAAERRLVALRLDAAPSPGYVEADVGLMERVLENLIGNALRHTPAGGEVRLGLREDGDQLSIQVADNGCGIPAGELPFIFDRFYRAANHDGRGSEGAGLGLAISKRILELHGSRLSAESDGHSGTCFTFSLPLLRAASDMP